MPPPPEGFGPIPVEGPSADDRLIATLAHVLGLVVSLLTSGVLGFVVPLVIWLLKKDESPFVAAHAKEAMVFQIAMVIAGIVIFILAILFACLTAGLGIILIIPIAIGMLIVAIIFPILGAMAANKGQLYAYPLIGNMF